MFLNQSIVDGDVEDSVAVAFAVEDPLDLEGGVGVDEDLSHFEVLVGAEVERRIFIEKCGSI